MSLFGKVLAILNLVALLGFTYMAVADFQMRHTWAYAVFRWDVALDGIPLDESDADQQGRPRHVNMTEKLSEELFNDSAIRTQIDFLDARKQELRTRIEDPNIKPARMDPTVKPAKVDRIVEVLMALAETPAEREAFLASSADKSPANEQKLMSQLETAFDRIKQIKDSGNDKDDEAKRLAVARALVSLLDLLPTEAEKNERAKAGQQADPTADPIYRRTANALGVRMMSRALDLQAQEYLAMGTSVEEVRRQERTAFVYQHQTILSQLQNREHQFQEQKDKLAVVLNQAKLMEIRAGQQEGAVTKLSGELIKKYEVTAAEMRRLIAEQEKLHRIRLLLRDANQKNQRMEQDIRKFEAELESENP